MQRRYVVYYKSNEVGYIDVIQKGLYLVFSGILDLEHGKLWKVMSCGNDLGICLFKSGYYIVEKKLPKKMFSNSDLDFALMDVTAVHISEDKPFSKLEKIGQGRVIMENGSLIFFADGDH